MEGYGCIRVGNNADTDDDNDGVDDFTDDLPLDPAESVDTDGDGIGNNADTDDDGDGVPDENMHPIGSERKYGYGWGRHWQQCRC